MPELGDALRRGSKQLRHVINVERVDPSAMMHPPLFTADSSVPLIRGYLIKREINAGGQGTVYEAIQESTGRRVAVKLVTGFSRHNVARFEREVKTLAGLEHPGIVSVIDSGRISVDSYFLVMEYVEGQNLDQWLASLPSTKDSLADVLAIFQKIAIAIQAAHEQGIIHRDLKPSNIRVDTRGEPRIVDFGLAHLVDSDEKQARQLTMTGNIVGSVPWISPEQARGDSTLTPASDVYTLGVLIYHALTGAFPYPVDGPLYVVTRHICEQRPANPVRAERPPFGRVNPTLASVIVRCLAKAPNERFATGGELAGVLDDFRHGRLRLPKDHTRVFRALAAILIIAIAVVAWPIFHRSRAVEPPAVFPLPRFTNSIEMEFVKIPAGKFRMGSEINEPGHQPSEQPHAAEVNQPFYVSVTEVTQAQYRRVMGELPSSITKRDDNLPVDFVTAQDAADFCRKLSTLDHRQYRLPSETEWEYACRAGSTKPYGEPGKLDYVAVYSANSAGHLSPVKSKWPNQFGLYDMLGNVEEWTGDRYSVSFPGNSAAASSAEEEIVTRGGSAFADAPECRCATRRPRVAGARRAGLGFRVVAESSDR